MLGVSSDPSGQSATASHRSRSGIQVPSLHWNFDWGQLLGRTWAVVVRGAGVVDRVFGLWVVVGPTGSTKQRRITEVLTVYFSV